MKTLIALYRRLFPKHNWTYSHDGECRTCNLTGEHEAIYYDDWGSHWFPCESPREYEENHNVD